MAVRVGVAVASVVRVQLGGTSHLLGRYGTFWPGHGLAREDAQRVRCGHVIVLSTES